jgi:hypothetical protein
MKKASDAAGDLRTLENNAAMIFLDKSLHHALLLLILSVMDR